MVVRPNTETLHSVWFRYSLGAFGGGRARASMRQISGELDLVGS